MIIQKEVEPPMNADERRSRNAVRASNLIAHKVNAPVDTLFGVKHFFYTCGGHAGLA
jgi:hypothetical protein